MNNQFSSVPGSASNDVWAVGIGDATLATPLVEHWDGTVWTFVTLSGPTNSNELFGVATNGASDVWAVGESFINNPMKPFTEHWDGASWKNQRSPNPGQASLGRVEILGAKNIWAVEASFDGGSGEYVPLIERSKGPCCVARATTLSSSVGPSVGAERTRWVASRTNEWSGRA